VRKLGADERGKFQRRGGKERTGSPFGRKEERWGRRIFLIDWSGRKPSKIKGRGPFRLKKKRKMSHLMK